MDPLVEELSHRVADAVQTKPNGTIRFVLDPADRDTSDLARRLQDAGISEVTVRLNIIGESKTPYGKFTFAKKKGQDQSLNIGVWYTSVESALTILAEQINSSLEGYEIDVSALMQKNPPHRARFVPVVGAGGYYVTEPPRGGRRYRDEDVYGGFIEVSRSPYEVVLRESSLVEPVREGYVLLQGGGVRSIENYVRGLGGASVSYEPPLGRGYPGSSYGYPQPSRSEARFVGTPEYIDERHQPQQPRHIPTGRSATPQHRIRPHELRDDYAGIWHETRNTQGEIELVWVQDGRGSVRLLSGELLKIPRYIEALQRGGVGVSPPASSGSSMYGGWEQSYDENGQPIVRFSPTKLT